MFNKINIKQIIADHLATLQSFRTGKVSIGDLVVFFGLPGVLSALIVWLLHYKLGRDFSNVLITSLSVFSALLFNLLLLIYDILRKEDKEKEESKLRRRFLKEIYANISFSILVSVITIILLLLLFVDIQNEGIISIINFFIYFLVTNFILTLLMVLKRVHILLSQEMK